MAPWIRISLIAAALVLQAAVGGAAAERLPGPVPAVVERVVDGDTLAVRAHIWLGQEVRVLVRLRGVDAGEWAARCARERASALGAATWLEAVLAQDRTVLLTDISADKYGGRVLAEVWSGERNLGRALLDLGLARPYAGGRRERWCGE